MSHSKVEASRTRRVFSEEFKQDAVRLVVSENYTFAAAAKAVGVGEQSLRKWHARLAPKPEPCGENASLDTVGDLAHGRLAGFYFRKPAEISGHLSFCTCGALALS
jgi:Transposase